jgi:hypothetical protein
MSSSTKSSILKTVEQKFRLGEVVLVVSLMRLSMSGNVITFHNPHRYSKLIKSLALNIRIAYLLS